MATKQYHVYRWIDGSKCELAEVFDDLAEAEEYVRENNAESGGHTYGIDPADLEPSQTTAYYACSQYESADGGSGYEWSCDGEFATLQEAILVAVDTANGAILDESGTKIEVYVYLATARTTDTDTILAGRLLRYGKFSKEEQGTILGSDLIATK